MNFLFQFYFSWGSLIFAFSDAVVPDVSTFYLNVNLCFLFHGGQILRRQFCFGAGRMRFMLIDAAEVVLFFESYLLYSVFLIVEASFLFLEKTIFVPRIILFKVSVII